MAIHVPALPLAPRAYDQGDQDRLRRLIEQTLAQISFDASPGSVAGTLDGLSDVTITGAAAGDTLRYTGTAWVNSAFLKNFSTSVVIGTDIGGSEHLRVEGSISIGGTSAYSVAGVLALYRSGGWMRLGNDGSSWIALGKTGDPTNYYDADTHAWRTKDGAAALATLSAIGLYPSTSGLPLGLTGQRWGVAWFNGTHTVGLGTITALQRVHDDSVTWNNAGLAFIGDRFNLVVSAAAAGSKMVDWQIGGTTRFAISPFTGVSVPFLALTPGDNTPALGITTNYITGAGSSESALTVTANMNTTGNPSLVYINAVNAGGAGASTQIFRVARDGGTQFTVLWEGNVGIAGGSTSGVQVRIGTGTAPSDISQGLQVNTTLTAVGGASHIVQNILGGGIAGTYTTPVVTSVQIGTYVKATNQTITTWYGLDILAGPTAGTKWSIRTAESVWIKGNLVVDGTITGVLGSGFAALDDLSDVIITTPAANHYLRHNGTNWVNQNGVAEADITDGTILARVGSSETISGAWDFTGLVTMNPSGSGTPLTVTGDGTNYVAVFNHGGSRVTAIDPDLGIEITGGTLTTLSPFFYADATWNASGVSFYGIWMVITNTASAAGSRVIRIEDATDQIFGVDIQGRIYVGTNKVVESRKTGYTAMTGTADRATSYATSTITLQQLAERVKALQDDLTTHGLIGA